MLKKYYFPILCLLFSFVTPILAQDSIDSSRISVVKIVVPKAVIYADDSLNNPIGFISNGKMVSVGKPLLKNREVLPIIISGRIAYIHSKDINYENDDKDTVKAKRGAPREHNVDILIEKTEEKLSENNSAYLSIQTFGGGDQISNLAETIDGEQKSYFAGYALSLIHRKENSRLFYGAGYEYDTFSTQNISINYFLLSPTIGFTPVLNPLFLIDVFSTVDFSVGAELNIDGNSTNEESAFVWGPTINARILFFPNNKYHLFGTFGIKSYNVTRPETLTNLQDTAIEPVTKIQGFNLSVGISVDI